MGTLKQAVDNVLMGQSALEGKPSGLPSVNFTKDEGARLALADACERLGHDIRKSFDLEDDDCLTSLIAKLAVYCAKHGWNTGVKITNGMEEELPVIAEALKGEPDALMGKAGIAGLLKKHHQKAAQDNAEERQRIMNGNSKEPVYVMKAGDHDLFELLNPKQIKAEGRRMKNCLEKSYNEDLMMERGLNEQSPGASRYLSYAVKVRNREARMFSFRDAKGSSKVTIEYNIDKKRIENMEGKDGTKINPDASYFKDLCALLHRLGDVLDLSGGIRCLPKPENNMVLKDEGFVSYYRGLDIGDILCGQVALDENMPQEEVRVLASCPNLTLDLTNVSNEWLDGALPQKVTAELMSQTHDVLELENLEYARKIEVPYAGDIKLHALKEADEINADQTLRLYAPKLEKAKMIWADNLVFLALPSLTHIHELISQSAGEVRLLALKSARDLYLRSASSVVIPEGACWYLDAPRVTNAPALHKSGSPAP